jgi:cobalt-zinc-cadmium resistance protein CzcA
MGSETQKPFAVVIVCGMATTLLVALLVVPMLYRLLAAKNLKQVEDDALDFSPRPGAHH